MGRLMLAPMPRPCRRTCLALGLVLVLASSADHAGTSVMPSADRSEAASLWVEATLVLGNL